VLTLELPFPAIGPVLIELGPFAIRWYALAYIAGLVLGWQYVKRLVQRPGWRSGSSSVRGVGALRPRSQLAPVARQGAA
jgi:prolipoprotein diacylglyceryltransferase